MGSLRHEGLHYRGLRDLVNRVVPFVRTALDHGDPVLVLEAPAAIAALRAALGSRAAEVEWKDVTELGRNPACMLGVWRDFTARHPGRPVRGVGESLWSGRSPAEAVECHLHEALMNLVLGDADAWIVCPCDLDALSPVDVEAAARTHPVLHTSDGHRDPSPIFDPERVVQVTMASPLPAPALVGATPGQPFGGDDLAALRQQAEAVATAGGLSADRSSDVAVVLSELATNSIRHGGGGGLVSHWWDGDAVVHQVSDHGHLADPAAGRLLPPVDQPGGRGLWLVHHLSDLVQLRSDTSGTTVRVTLGPR